MKFTFVIPGRLPGLNEIVNANRSHRMAGASLKKVNTAGCAWQIKAQGVPVFTRPISISIKWIEPNGRRDLDNIASGIKFVLDGMQMAEVIAGDGRLFVRKLTHEFPPPDKDNPRIEVTIEEIA